MRKGILAAAVGGMLAVGTMAPAAQAETVTFESTGLFNGSSSSITFGSGANTTTISFTGVTVGLPGVNAPTFVSLGEFDVDITGLGGGAGSGTFLLTVDQTLPEDVDGSFGPATLSGTIKANSSGATLVFEDPTSIQLGPITYALDLTGQLGDTLKLPAANTNGGITTLGATLAVPLPAAAWGGMALLGTLGGYRLRRRYADNGSL